jgi:hypothetical protein
MIMSFLRSVIFRYPTSFRMPMSPVWSQPSVSIASAVVRGHQVVPADKDLTRLVGCEFRTLVVDDLDLTALDRRSRVVRHQLWVIAGMAHGDGAMGLREAVGIEHHVETEIAREPPHEFNRHGSCRRTRDAQ